MEGLKNIPVHLSLIVFQLSLTIFNFVVLISFSEQERKIIIMSQWEDGSVEEQRVWIPRLDLNSLLIPQGNVYANGL